MIGRYSIRCGCAHLLALGFPVEEEEGPVAEDRTTDRSAKAILQAWRNGVGSGGLRIGVACEVGVARTEVVRAAVEFVGAGTGLGSHDGGDSLAEFGVIVLGGDLSFSHRI